MFKTHFCSDDLEHLLALIQDLKPKTGTIEVVVDHTSGIGNVVKARVPVLPASRTSADSDFTATTGSALRILTVGSGTTLNAIAVDNVISQGGIEPKARAYVDKNTAIVAGTSATLLYHQNENTGFVPFTVGGDPLLDSAENANNGTIVSDSDAEVDPFSGDLLYVESRAAVERTTAGTEDIKITIQF